MNRLGNCPVDLHYQEPEPARLDLVMIIARGRRIRRRHAATWAGAAVAACAAIASVVAGVQAVSDAPAIPAAGPPPARGPLPLDALIAAHPPADGILTLVSASPRHWTTVAWTTRHGYVCWASFRTPMLGSSYDVQCPAWPPQRLPGRGPRAVGSLTLGISPAESQLLGHWPVLGLVSPQAVRVTLSASGFISTVNVARVPLGDGRAVGVFISWAPPEHTTAAFGATSREIVLGPGGRIIAQRRHWDLTDYVGP